MTKADQLIDRAANRLREAADRVSAQGGLAVGGVTVAGLATARFLRRITRGS